MSAKYAMADPEYFDLDPTEVELCQEVYENERVLPFGGWKYPFLPVDFPHWSDEKGHKRRKPDDLILIPNGNWDWVGDWTQSEWEYAYDFRVDRTWSRRKGFLDSVRRRVWRRTRRRNKNTNKTVQKCVFRRDLSTLQHVVHGTPVKNNLDRPKNRSSKDRDRRASAGSNSSDSLMNASAALVSAAHAKNQSSSSAAASSSSGVVKAKPARLGVIQQGTISMSMASLGIQKLHEDYGLDTLRLPNEAKVGERESVWVVEESYQNERWAFSWGPPTMPTDPYAWSDKKGKHSRPLHELDELPESSHPHTEWRWISQWALDMSGKCDDQGWRYSGGFHLRSAFSKDHKGAMDSARRRRWFRIRVLDVSRLMDTKEKYATYRVLRSIISAILWHLHWTAPDLDTRRADSLDRPRSASPQPKSADKRASASSRLLRHLSASPRNRLSGSKHSRRVSADRSTPSSSTSGPPSDDLADEQKTDRIMEAVHCVSDVYEFYTKTQVHYRALRGTAFDPTAHRNQQSIDVQSSTRKLFENLLQTFSQCYFPENQRDRLSKPRVDGIVKQICDQITAITKLRAQYVSLRYLSLLSIQFLMDIIGETVEASKKGTSVLEVICLNSERVARYGHRLFTTGQVEFDALQAILDILGDVELFFENPNPTKSKPPASMNVSWEALVESDEPQQLTAKLYERVGSWLGNYHAAGDPERLAGVIAKCLNVRARLGSLLHRFMGADDMVAADVGTVMFSSARHMVSSFRDSFLPDPAEWSPEEWKSFAERFLRDLHLEVEVYLPALDIPGVEFPAQYTMGAYLKEFHILSTDFFENVPEDELSERVYVVFRLCSDIRELLNSRLFRALLPQYHHDASPSAKHGMGLTTFLTSKKKEEDHEHKALQRLLAQVPDCSELAAKRVRVWKDQQFSQIRGWIQEGIEKEDWLPLADEKFSHSVIDTFSYIHRFEAAFIEYLTKVRPTGDPKFLQGCAEEFVFAVGALLNDYVGLLVSSNGINVSSLRKRVEKAELAMVQQSSSLWSDITNPKYVLTLGLAGGSKHRKSGSKEEKGDESEMFNKPVLLGKEADIPAMCVRFSNLSMAKRKIDQLTKRLVRDIKALDDDAQLASLGNYLSMRLIDQNASVLEREFGYRVIYVDLCASLFGKVYRRDASTGQLESIGGVLDSLSLIFEKFPQVLSEEDSKKVVTGIFTVFMTGLEFIFLKSERTFGTADTELLRRDLKEMTDFFADYMSLDDILSSSEFERVALIIDHMEKKTAQLIELHKSLLAKEQPTAAARSYADKATAAELKDDAQQTMTYEKISRMMNTLHRHKISMQSDDLADDDDEAAHELTSVDVLLVLAHRESTMASDYAHRNNLRLPAHALTDPKGKGKHAAKSIKNDYEYSLTVDINEARKLPVMDRMSKKADPYVVIECGDFRFKTKVKKKSLSPTWNETFCIGVNRSRANQGTRRELKISVFDWDWGRDDDLIGESSLYLKDFFAASASGSASKTVWVDLHEPKNLLHSRGEVSVTITLAKNK